MNWVELQPNRKFAMDAIRFISWWWKKRDASERILTLVLTAAVILIPGMFFFGIAALAAFFLTFILIMVSWGAYGLWIKLKEQWDIYQSERELEAQRIISRLKGSR